jgi:hypothetical protein
MPPNLLLAMNTGRDPSGMFPAVELAEHTTSCSFQGGANHRGSRSCHSCPRFPCCARGESGNLEGGGKWDGGFSSETIREYVGGGDSPKQEATLNRQRKWQRSATIMTAKGSEHAEPSESAKQDVDRNAPIGGDESKLQGYAFANKDTVV